MKKCGAGMKSNGAKPVDRDPVTRAAAGRERPQELHAYARKEGEMVGERHSEADQRLEAEAVDRCAKVVERVNHLAADGDIVRGKPHCAGRQAD